MWLAEGIVIFAVGYICVGGILSVWLLLRGLQRLDPIAQQAGWGFKLLIFPGLCALWPLWLLKKGSGKQQA
jgi:hypothetical protein